MRFNTENCCAIVIDYQERLVPAMNGKEKLITQSQKLLKGLELLGIPMIITEQYPRGLGSTVAEIKQAAPSAEVFAKTSFSALGCEEVAAKIRQFKSEGRENVLICGMESHVCVFKTALDVIDEGMNAVFVTDCIASRDPADLMAAMMRAEREGINFASAEMVLFELIGAKEHEHFKAISAIVK